MRHSILAFALSLAAMLPLTASADELTVGAGETNTPAAVSLPKKGELKSAVLKAYGEPQQKHAPVGGEAPTHPPITRWDYAGFSVFFERDHVVDTVVPGQPAKVYHTEALKPADSAK